MNFEKNGGFFSRQRVALIKWYKCAPFKKLLTVREGWIQSAVQMDCWPENSKLRKLFGFLANIKDKGAVSVPRFQLNGFNSNGK